MAMVSHQPKDSQPAGHGMADMASGACFDLCGYCSLLHHNPPLMALIPAAPPLPIQCAPVSFTLFTSLLLWPPFHFIKHAPHRHFHIQHSHFNLYAYLFRQGLLRPK